LILGIVPRTKKELAMIRVSFRHCIFALVAVTTSTLVLAPGSARGQTFPLAPAQADLNLQQQYQVSFLKDNVAGSATFLFATDTLNADGTTSGSFTANVEGNLVAGRFLELNLGGESLWVARAAGSQVGFLARGWKTPDRLVGEGTVSMAAGGQIFQETFFLLGQGVIPLAQAPANAQPPAAPPSAQPNTGPGAPDARP
jgi:hypothetical protein